ncbi:hypothetical protein R3W88_011657 [Solanum pinnatisectum]|uniref:CCHC-type domain-containing protein n=1 Tax=Solanum pinnatisectum TaxID=50273 RepID=A0AAV9L7Z2_9SOLN|nr:hypothetical protein R3W88_011657 [Solanum pinnatisectum]
MTRTSATVTGGRREALPEAVVEASSRGRGRARVRDRASGVTLARGPSRGVAPVMGHAREVSLETQIDDIEDQVPPEITTTPLLQDTLLRVLILTTCRELLEVVGLAESYGVRYATLQLRGPAREWWRTYSGSLPIGSPPRFCFTCGDPDHLMRQCTSHRGRGGPQPNSSFQARPSVPQGRGRGRVQSGRGGRASSSVELGLDLTFEEEPIAILERQVRKLRTMEIALVKVHWKHRSVGEATWEAESDMRARYPHLFETSGTCFYLMFEDGHNF